MQGFEEISRVQKIVAWHASMHLLCTHVLYMHMCVQHANVHLSTPLCGNDFQKQQSQACSCHVP